MSEIVRVEFSKYDENRLFEAGGYGLLIFSAKLKNQCKYDSNLELEHNKHVIEFKTKLKHKKKDYENIVDILIRVLGFKKKKCYFHLKQLESLNMIEEYLYPDTLRKYLILKFEDDIELPDEIKSDRLHVEIHKDYKHAVRSIKYHKVKEIAKQQSSTISFRKYLVNKITELKKVKKRTDKQEITLKKCLDKLSKYEGRVNDKIVISNRKFALNDVGSNNNLKQQGYRNKVKLEESGFITTESGYYIHKKFGNVEGANIVKFNVKYDEKE